MAANVSGGKSLGQAYADNFDFGLRFDMQKLVGWDGAKIVVSGINRDGQNLTADHVGNFYPVQQVYGRETLLLVPQHFQWNEGLSNEGILSLAATK